MNQTTQFRKQTLQRSSSRNSLVVHWLLILSIVLATFQCCVVVLAQDPSPSLSITYHKDLSFNVKSSIKLIDDNNVCQLGIVAGKYTTLKSLNESANYTMQSIPCSSESVYNVPYHGYPFTKFLLQYDNSKQQQYAQRIEYISYFPTFTATLGNSTHSSLVYNNHTLSFYSNITSNMPNLECRADVVIDGVNTTVYKAICTSSIQFSVPLLPQYFKNKQASIVITLSNKEYYFEESESFDFELTPCTLQCKNGGLCKKQADGFAYCDCPTSYTGELCQSCKPGYVLKDDVCVVHNPEITCFGKPSTNSSVCSGHGTCTDIDFCKCSPGYSGKTCSVPICFSLDATEFGVCFGNGQCVAPDTCKCNTLFSGKECSVPTCNGKTESEGGCSFHGTCSLSHTCTCSGNFQGASCSSCKTGFTGEQCDVPICNGIQATDKSVCSGRGSCTSTNGSTPICACSGEYFGVSCGSFRCNGIDKNSQSVCSSSGTCTSPGVCACKGNRDPSTFCSTCLPSYSGSDCSTPICKSETTCSGKGECNAQLQCVCSGNYAGSFCEKCKDGFVGSTCSYACSAATTCSGRGTCSQIGECICSGNTNGKSCESCQEGWFGDKCDFRISTNTFEFNENGDSIIATVKSSIKRNIACSSLITNTDVLGISPSCSLDSEKSQLVIQLGPAATIVIGGTLNVRAYFGSSSVSVATVSGSNYKIVDPEAQLTSEKTSIACGSVTLDASGSASLDRRKLLFSYSVTIAPSLQDRATLNSLLANSTSSTVKFPVSQLNQGTYTVQAAVQSSFSGRSSYATFTFYVTESAPPVLTIRNGLSSTFTIGNSYAIVPVVSFPSCYRGNPSTSNLQFTYTQTSGPTVQIKQKNEMLVLGGSYTQISDAGDYVFTLKAQEPGYPEATLSFKVSATTLPLKVAFNIRDMSQSMEDNVKFRITKQDPSNPTSTDGQVQLTCTNTETMETCSGFDNGLNIDQTSLSFDRSFNSGTFLFTATFTKGSRTTSATVKITVTNQSKSTFLRIYIDSSSSDLTAVDPSNDLILQAQSLDTLSSQRQFKWSSSDLTFDSSIDTTKKYITIPKSVLVAGATFSVSVTVNDVFKSGEAKITFVVNSPPSLGVLEISPSTGIALTDEFKVACGNGWSDAHLPLSYKFMFRVKGQDSWRVLKERSEKRSFTTLLPSGELEIKSIVYDSKGAFTETTSSVVVTKPDVSASIQSLNVISNATVTSSSASSALQMLSSFGSATPEQKQQLGAAGAKIVLAYFQQQSAEENVTAQSEASTSSSLSVISSVSSCVDILDSSTTSVIIVKFKSTVDGAFLTIKLTEEDITSALGSATVIQNHVSNNLKGRSLLSFSKDQVKSLDEVKETLLSLQLKNAVPDMPATRTFGSDYHAYARLLSVSSLSSLNETVGNASSISLYPSFNSLNQVASLDSVKLALKVQSQANAVSKLFTFKVESNNVDLAVQSASNTSYIADLTIEKNPSTRDIRESSETKYSCVVSENGQLVSSSRCEIASSSGSSFTVKVSAAGSYAIVAQEVVIVPPTPKPQASNGTTVLPPVSSSPNLAYLALLTLIIPVVALVVIGAIIMVCCIKKKKLKDKYSGKRDELSLMEMREI